MEGSTRESGTTRKQLTRPESTASRRVGAHVVVGDAQLLEVAQEVAVQQLELVRSLLHPNAQTRTLEESSLFNSSLSEVSFRGVSQRCLSENSGGGGF